MYNLKDNLKQPFNYTTAFDYSPMATDSHTGNIMLNLVKNAFKAVA